MKQTAVEWLEKNIKLDMSPFELIECFNHAKAMEKEQIIDAVKYGNSFEQDDLRHEVYYNKTFKSESNEQGK